MKYTIDNKYIYMYCSQVTIDEDVGIWNRVINIGWGYCTFLGNGVAKDASQLFE